MAKIYDAVLAAQDGDRVPMLEQERHDEGRSQVAKAPIGVRVPGLPATGELADEARDAADDWLAGHDVTDRFVLAAGAGQSAARSAHSARTPRPQSDQRASRSG